MSLLGLLLVVLFLAALAIGAAALLVSLGPVPRPRLDRFVSRTGVRFSAANAPYVLDALARTMRWRTAGVVVVVAGCFAWDVLHESLTVTTYTGVVLAAGFLVGSVAGEVGNAVTRSDGPRTASLEARREEDYVGSWAATWPLACGLVSIPLAVAVVVVHGEILSVSLLLGTAVVAWAAGRVCTRLVLERSRPAVPGDDAAADADIVAADDGLRSRALHAVGGAVLLAGTWAVITLAAGLVQGDPSRDGVIAAVAILVMAVTAYVAWRIATGPFLVVDVSVAPEGAGVAPEGAGA